MKTHNVMRKALIVFWWLSATAAAFAAEESIPMAFTPQEVAAIIKSMDRQPPAQNPPDGFWTAQQKIAHAIDTTPQARAAVDRLLTAKRR